MSKTLLDMYGIIREYFDFGVEFLVLVIEIIGTFVLMYAVISAVVELFKKKKHIRLRLAEGIAFALELKMGGELLRTVIVRDFEELLILGSIIILRAALTFIIQWEIRTEKKYHAEELLNEEEKK